jgi:uncharacterized membrane protein
MKRALLISFGLASACLAGSLYVWPQVGEVVPTHWGIDGRPDGFGSRSLGLLLLPGLVVVITLIFAVLTRLDPRREHVERSSGALGWVLLSIVGLLAYMHALMLRAMLGDGALGSGALLFGVGVMLVVLGNALPKIRSNFWTGIRTPWTLSSERVWHRTHRLGGMTMAASGVLTIVAALALPASAAFVAMLLVTMLGSVVPIGMSYVYWKQEQPTV